MQKAIKIIKNRSDIGAGTRGSDMGVDAIEIAAINSNSDYFNEYEFEDVKTHNESIYDKYRSSVAKRIEHVVEQCTRVNNTVKKSRDAINEKIHRLMSFVVFIKAFFNAQNLILDHIIILKT